MKNVLVLNTSLSGPASVSDPIVEEAVRQVKAAHPGVTLVRRDLARQPIPHLLPDNFLGVRAQATTPAEIAARDLSDTLIAELNAADLVIAGVPMYNFSVPTTFRTWFDHVARPGVTFGYVDGAPKGFVADKPVVIVSSRGGFYSDGPAKAYDFQEPYLRTIFAFIGITDLRFVRAEKIGFGPEARAASIAEALASLPQVLKSRAA